MAIYKNLSADQIKQIACMFANEIERSMVRWKYFAESWDTLPAADLTALGLSEDWQTQIGSLKSDMAAIVAWYEANTQFVKRFTNLTVV